MSQARSKVDREVQALVDRVVAAGWHARPNGNHTRFIFTGPTGATVSCPFTTNKKYILRSVIRDLAKAGLDLDLAIPPEETTVGSAMMEAIKRREKKITPQEAGEDREPAEVIIRHPKGSGSGLGKGANSGPYAKPGEPPRKGKQPAANAFTTLHEAMEAGIKFSQATLDRYTDDLTCRVCGQTILNVGGIGPHNRKHNKDGDVDVNVVEALQVLTDALTKPDASTEVADLKRRLKIVRDALDKPLMPMMNDINEALKEIDLG